ncbi:MAG: EAL domain-containing protein [Aridibacter famidurans]|nr:EAL domain-containing protein [Aridibacter famidurans]
MNSRQSSGQSFYWLTIAAGISCIVAATFLLRTENLGAGLFFIAGSSLILSTITHIRLARGGVYFTLSEVLVFLWFVLYGSGIATLIAVGEAVAASLAFSRKSGEMSVRSASLAGSIAAIGTFGTAMIVRSIFGSLPESAASASDASIVLMMALMVVSQFLIRSILLAVHSNNDSVEKIWNVWFKRCLNGFALYVIGALGAGLVLRASDGRDLFLILAGLLIGAVVFFTYRRYAKEIRNSLERAEAAEKGRAKEARAHVRTLERHIARLEKAEKELSQSEAKFRRAAYHDSLTDLPNRRFLDLELEKASGRVRKTGSYSFAIVYLDLNRFAAINESLGREVADRFLIAISEKLTGLLRGDDFLARLSGDEFVILLSDVSNEADALHFAELAKRKLSGPFTIDGKILFAAATIGIAICNSSLGHEDPLRRAQIAKQEAKSAEKPYLVYNEAMYRSAMSRLQVENDLRGALERGEFEPFFQPIVDLESMETAGFEALIRWNHPSRGLVGPGEFIPVCESSGMIVPLTSWMLEEGCRSLGEWRKECRGLDKVFISVNLSAKDFVEDGLVERVTECIKHSGIEAGCLKLEITESAIMNNSEKAVELLKELKALGVRLSIDDFGTGYSSLSYLHRFPVDTLKVDRSFVSSMEFGSENGEIVRTVITLAKLLGMKIISEGIETIHQLHQLKILKCEYGQGNLFSMPVPAAQALAILKDANKWKGLDPAARPEGASPPKVENYAEFHNGTNLLH